MNNATKNTTTKIMLTVREFATLSGIGQNQVRAMCRIAGFPAVKVGTKILIHAKEGERWLQEMALRQEGIATAALRKVCQQ